MVRKEDIVIKILENEVVDILYVLGYLILELNWVRYWGRVYFNYNELDYKEDYYYYK